MLKGIIVENSLQDKSILSQLQIQKTWHDEDWILHEVLIEESKANNVGKYLLDGPWYVHFWEPGQDRVMIVFKNV